MLIPLDHLIREFDLKITGVTHVGAHQGEERFFYDDAGIKNVLWIEGNPDLIAQLRLNVAPFHHDVACALIGAEPGEAVLHVANNGQSSSVLDLGTHLDVHPEVGYVSEKTLPVKTLDHVVGHHWAFGNNFLNIDLQGYELEALKGGEQTLAKADYVFSEVNVDSLYVGCVLLHDLNDYLEARGFKLVALKMANEVVGWGDGVWIRERLL